MTVPDFQTMMLPSLRSLSDGQPRSVGQVADAVAVVLRVSPQDQAELLPSGTQSRYRNRVNWALHHMKQAAVLDSPARGRYRITPRGQALLAEAPSSISMKTLDRYEEYREFKKRRHEKDAPTVLVTSEDGTASPQERLETAYAELRSQLAHELLERLRAMDPLHFEKVVLDVLVAMGYGGSLADRASLTARTGDHGIDGIIKEDKLGLDIVVVQAKQWSGQVGEKEIREFAGALERHRARKGVFITTATFSGPARDYVKMIEKRIVLIDGVELAELMMDHDVGVSVTTTVRLQRIDTDYFEQEDDL